MASSTYSEVKARDTDPERIPVRAKRDALLCDDVTRVWRANRRVTGVKQVWMALNREWMVVARCTVARLMRQLGLRGAVRGRRAVTTVSIRPRRGTVVIA